MKFENFKEIFSKEMINMSLKFNEDQFEKFYNYMNLLLEWNKKINLTAITIPEEIITKHFIDSLSIAKYMKEESCLIDVGTGAGFPGIPLKIAFPKMKIVLLDSLNKRIIFLKEVINQLNLKGIECLHSRAEDAGKDKEYREKFDYVTARAVANLNILMEYTVPFAKKNGKCIYMKSNKAEDEINNAKNAFKELKCKIDKTEKFKLANTDIQRTIIVVKKSEITSNKYPRQAGIPIKRPI